MPFRRRHAEPVLKAPLPGRRQGDLGKQDENLATIGQNPLNGIEIHFGLSRPGHPVKECRREPRSESGSNVRRGGGLVGRQRRARLYFGLRRRRLVTDQDHFKRSGCGHCRDNAGTDAGLALKFGCRQGAGQVKDIANTAARLGQPLAVRELGRPTVELALRRRAKGPRLAEGHFHHGTDGRHRPGGDTFQKIDKGWRQRRQRGDAGYRLQRFRRHLAATGTKDDPRALARAEGNADDLAARQFLQSVETVIERAVERHGDGNPHGGRPGACFAFNSHVRNGSALLRQVDSPPVLRYTPRVGTAEFNLHRRADFST